MTLVVSPDFIAIVDAMRSRPWPDRAADIEREAYRLLQTLGFRCRRRSPQPYDRHRGFINIVAERNGSRIGIEIDRRRPRHKSIRKLRRFDGERLIIVRCGHDLLPYQEHGIDLVLSVEPLPKRK